MESLFKMLILVCFVVFVGTKAYQYKSIEADQRQNADVALMQAFDNAITANDSEKAIETAHSYGICSQGLELLDTMSVYINNDEYDTDLQSLSDYCDLMNP